jgi:hypothetical protein
VDLAPSRALPQDGALRVGAVHTRKLIGVDRNRPQKAVPGPR